MFNYFIHNFKKLLILGGPESNVISALVDI